MEGVTLCLGNGSALGTVFLAVWSLRIEGCGSKPRLWQPALGIPIQNNCISVHFRIKDVN